MSKVIRGTRHLLSPPPLLIMMTLLLVLFALFIGASQAGASAPPGLSVADQSQTATATPTQPPQPVLTFTKTASAASVSPGDVIYFKVTVVNSGFGDATGLTITDNLPVGVDWSLPAVYAGCAITDVPNSPGHQRVICAPEVIGKRHLNDTQTDFVNGEFDFVVYAIAGQCGSVYTNTALLTRADGSAGGSNTVSITVSCPTPTPVPTTPTATPTPIITPTPTATIPIATTTAIVTVTDVVNPITATPTPKGKGPLPPNTGSGVGPSSNNGGPSDDQYASVGEMAVGGFLVLLGIAFIVTGHNVAKKR